MRSTAADRAGRSRGRCDPIWPGDPAPERQPRCPTRCSRGRCRSGPQLFGAISFELFGHLHNVIHDYDAFFDLQMGRAVQYLIAGANH